MEYEVFVYHCCQIIEALTPSPVLNPEDNGLRCYALMVDDESMNEIKPECQKFLDLANLDKNEAS